MSTYRSGELPFKPRARLLLLLGNELIRDSGIAVFELVKNAYDADATEATVTMYDIEDFRKARIVIEDNGTGMDWETVTGIWLEPGTNNRAQDRKEDKRTPKFRRLPLGEKGVGRFAAHKLGKQITLITRSKDKSEVIVEIDWESFRKRKYLKDVEVSVSERSPKVFPKNKTGTRIEIKELRDKWTRGMARNLHRAVTSICSPFGGPPDFKARLVFEPDNDWLRGLLDVSKVLEFALFKASCKLVGKKLSYHYSFRPLSGMDRVSAREVRGRIMNLPEGLDLEGSAGNSLHIGPLEFELHIFDLDPQVLQFGSSDRKGLREFLKENGGIRVYREGIRVYNYGEPENDWLDLGGRRVNVPTRRISNNIVIGAVSLSLKESRDLVEKTNREGFVENEAYRVFWEDVSFAVKQIETERFIDKERIRRAYSQQRQKEPVLEELNALRERVKKHKLEKELNPYLDRIESQFREVMSRLLTAAGSGLTLAVVIHEVEKGIATLTKAVEKEISPKHVRELAKHLSELVEGLTYLTRKSGKKKEKASILINHALFNTDYRLSGYNIEVVKGLDKDFEVRCTRRLIIATLMNLIDNSIYWLNNKGAPHKSIYMGTTVDLGGVPAIIVADNGPGFSDPPEYLIQPFFTRKPDGMGLGLHLASEIMKVHGGRLEFPQEADVNLPKGFDGAVLALIFEAEE